MDEDIRAIRRSKWMVSKANGQDNTSNNEPKGDIKQPKTCSKVESSVSKNSPKSMPKRRRSFITNEQTKTKQEFVDLTVDDAIDLTSDNDDIDANDEKKIFKSTKSQSTSKVCLGNASKSTSKSESKHITESSPNNTQLSLNVATYNIWFGPPHPQARMKQIASELISSNPTVIGLQEVTPELAQMLSPHLTKSGYKFHFQDDGSYGCALAIKTAPTKINDDNQQQYCEILKTGFLPFQNSIMGRGLLWAHVRILNHNTTANLSIDVSNSSSEIEFLFTTSHLESYMANYPTRGQTYGNTEREVQLQQACHFCESFFNDHPNVQMALVVGDLNWDDERKASQGSNQRLLSIIDEKKWKDAWLEGVFVNRFPKEDGKEGYSYDSRRNPMLKGNLRRRFDRILFCSKSVNSTNMLHASKNKLIASLDSISMIGKSVIEGLVWKKVVPLWGKPGVVNIQERPLMPSDHYGLLASIKIKSVRRLDNLSDDSISSSSSKSLL